MAMRVPSISSSRSLTARLAGGAALFLLVAGLFVVPLWSAMSVCAMPCCHHARPLAPILKTEMPCPFDCTVKRGEDVKEASTTQLPAAPQIAMMAAPVSDATLVEPEPPQLARTIGPAPPPDRALHLVHSVFLI